MALNKTLPSKSLKKLITCNHCKGTIQKPVRLQCVHHFCKKCTDKLEVKTVDDVQGISCPTCRQFNACASVSSDPTMQKFIDIYNTQNAPLFLPCELCSNKCSGKRCVECKINLCDNCSLSHTRIPLCKGHTIKSLAEVGIGSLTNCTVFCTEHPNKIIEFSCTECNKAICTECKILNHDTHGTDKISDAIAKLKPKLETKLKPLENKKRSLANKIKKLDILSEQISDKEAKLINEIQAQKIYLKKKLEEDATILIEKVKDKHNYKRQEISQFKDKALSRLSSIESIAEWTSSVQEYMEDVNLLQQLQGDVFTLLDEHQQSENPFIIQGLKMELKVNSFGGNLIGDVDSKTRKHPIDNKSKNEMEGPRPKTLKYTEITPVQFKEASQPNSPFGQASTSSNVPQVQLPNSNNKTEMTSSQKSLLANIVGKLPLQKSRMEPKDPKISQLKKSQMKNVSTHDPSGESFQHLMKQVSDNCPVLRHVPDERSSNFKSELT